MVSVHPRYWCQFKYLCLLREIIGFQSYKPAKLLRASHRHEQNNFMMKIDLAARCTEETLAAVAQIFIGLVTSPNELQGKARYQCRTSSFSKQGTVISARISRSPDQGVLRLIDRACSSLSVHNCRPVHIRSQISLAACSYVLGLSGMVSSGSGLVGSRCLTSYPFLRDNMSRFHLNSCQHVPS